MTFKIGDKLQVDETDYVLLIEAERKIGALVTASGQSFWSNRMWCAYDGSLGFNSVKDVDNITVEELVKILQRSANRIKYFSSGKWVPINSGLSYDEIVANDGVYKCVSHPSESDGRLIVAQGQVFYFNASRTGNLVPANEYWKLPAYTFELTNEKLKVV